MHPPLVDIHTHLSHPQHPTLRCAALHPWDAALFSGSLYSTPLPSSGHIDAVGEIGLDWACSVDHDLQLRLFEAQLQYACSHHLPVVIHCVKAFNECTAMLLKHTPPHTIFHGFIGSVEQASLAVSRGYHLSFGVRSFRSPKSIAAMRATPLDRLFFETDNDPTPLADVYSRGCALLGIELCSARDIIYRNYLRIINND